MKIVFFGSDDFALTNLEALLASKHEIVACVTQPDKPKGRGLKVSESPLKDCALKHKIPVLQPTDLKDPAIVKQLKTYNSDLFVVIAYGKILPVEILQIPRTFSINVHGSLLPKYRGAAPINWAIINGEKETGVSIIKMNPQMDAGDILTQAKIPIEEKDDAGTLRAKLADLSAKKLIESILAIAKNSYVLSPQDHSKATLAPKLTKELGLIDWAQPAVKIHNLIRGLLPKPAAYTRYEGKTLKILETEVVSNFSKQSDGMLMTISKVGFIVATGDGAILVKRIHLESSRAMEAAEFATGYKLPLGFQFS